MNALFFWLFSAGMLICALAVILNRNAVASALCFTFTIVFMSGLFVMLNAFFLAAVQIIVTAGAVMVLFLFIIMLLDITAMEHVPRQKTWMACALILALGFLLLVAKTLNATPQGFVASSRLSVNPYRHLEVEQVHPRGSTRPDLGPAPIFTARSVQSDDTHEIGYLLFATTDPNNPDPNASSYIAPFEVTSLLILVATIGVIVICKQDDPPRPRRREAIVQEAPPVIESLK